MVGLLEPTSGDIYLDGERINDLPTHQRDIHTVFQNYALFPHMNVFDNVAFALKLKKVDKEEIARRVKDTLKMVDLKDLKNVQFKNYQEDNANVLRLRERLLMNRASSYLMNRSQHLI